ncbi:MAG: ABC transporter permease subunit [Eubacteriales bacterium]|nr:ABC transporter permease subunit [Eubacteriales bacterium]
MTTVTIQPAQRKRHVSTFRKCLPLTLMALPGLIVLLLFKYLPMFGIVLAFNKYRIPDGIFGSKFVGLKNFEYLFRTSTAWDITRNTLLYNIVFILLGLVIPVAVAIILCEMRGRRTSKLYQTVYMVPYFLSWVVASFMFYAFLKVDGGLLNRVIVASGGTAVQWYSEPKYWSFILTLVNVWKATGYSAVMYIRSITAIPNEYYEAALLDGATKWQQIRHITIPSLRSMMIVLTILAIGKIFYADFGMFYNVPRNSGILYPVTNVIDTYVYNALKVSGDINMAAAANFYQSIIGFLLVLVSNLVVRRIDKDSALF